jgi:predicted P-loop ATPase
VREDRLQLHSAWIHEWGEIDTVMGKRESETLKRFLSCSRDDVRRPYGRGTEQLHRSCGIVGTTNRRDFIKDPTGNRRFPIIPITRVELGWIEDHRDAIWGSAMAAYLAGERWHYETEENAHLTVAAASFAAEDPLREAIEAWAEDHPEVVETCSVRILQDLGYSDQLKDQQLRLKAGNALTALGWQRTPEKRRYKLPTGDRTDRTWGWLRPVNVPPDVPA